MNVTEIADITPLRIINMEKGSIYAIMEPFILGVDVSTDKHVVCWLEWFKGRFDPKVAMSVNPTPSEHNTLKSFRSLPTFEVTIGGAKYSTFRAVCDRSLGGKIGSIKCDGGTLWTVLP